MPATRGEPTLHGSRAVQDMAYPTKHASDIEDAAPVYHNPVGTSSGYAPVWDGTKYVSTDVLTPAEHTAIGDGAPHHAALTLGANPGLSLSTQELVLGTPSTLTVSTTNAVSGTGHTHAITSSANPGATESLLKTDGEGVLTLAHATIVGNLSSFNRRRAGRAFYGRNKTFRLFVFPAAYTYSGNSESIDLDIYDAKNYADYSANHIVINRDGSGSAEAYGLNNSNFHVHIRTYNDVATGNITVYAVTDTYCDFFLLTTQYNRLSNAIDGTEVGDDSYAPAGVLVFDSIAATTSWKHGTPSNPFTLNMLGGNVGLHGVVSPTARLHLPAGSATASTAPLKFTSGTLLTTAEAGAVEFLTDDYFATITTGAARKAFVLDDGTRLTDGVIPVAHTNGRLIDALGYSANPGAAASILATDASGYGQVLRWTVGGAAPSGQGLLELNGDFYADYARGLWATPRFTGPDNGWGKRVFESSPTLPTGAAHTELRHYSIADVAKEGTATVATQYGIYIESLTAGTANYGIYSAGASNENVLRGNLVVGSLTRLAGTALYVAGHTGLPNGSFYGSARASDGSFIGLFYLDASDKVHIGSTTTGEALTMARNNVGVGSTITSPTARLHLPAGSATASTAPLKFTSGTLLTTAEAGAIEFLTDDFFATITTGAARKGIVLDDGTRLTATRVPFATTNGRLVDDADLTFSTDTLSATKVAASGGVTTQAMDFTASTPDALAGDVNNWDLGNNTFIRASGGAADRIVTGIVARASGHLLIFQNIGTTNKITFANESASSTAANRLINANAGSTEITPNHCIVYIYDATTARWREITHL